MARLRARARYCSRAGPAEREGSRLAAYVRALRASGWRGEAELYETPGEQHVYFLNKPDSEKAAKEMEVVADFINGGQGSSAALRTDA